MAARPIPPDVREFAERLIWTLIAVDRFGHYGTDEDTGRKLLRAKLIQPDQDGYVPTAMGYKFLQRLREEHVA